MQNITIGKTEYRRKIKDIWHPSLGNPRLAWDCSMSGEVMETYNGGDDDRWFENGDQEERVRLWRMVESFKVVSWRQKSLMW
jgi:hypothetical protein